MLKTLQNLLLALALVLVSCSEEPKTAFEKVKVKGEAQGTTYTIVYFDSLNETSLLKFQQQVKMGVDSLLYSIDNSMSTYNPYSTLSEFNVSDSCMIIDDHFLDVYIDAFKVFEETGGAFDPTVLPALNLWGFGPTKIHDFDSTCTDSMKYAYLDSVSNHLLSYIDLDEMQLGGDVFVTASDSIEDTFKDNYICKPDSSYQLDFNAIAQGYSVDQMARYLDQLGLENYLVELGGELKAKGGKPNDIPWKIEVENPFDLSRSTRAAIIELKDLGMATSGNYRKTKTLGSLEIGHTIDPRTAKPVVSDIVSITVFAKNTILADAYATAFMVMGVEETVSYVANNRTDQLEIYMIYKNDEGEVKSYVSIGLISVLENNIPTEV
jgi:FAD:protein FMN transferase